MRAFIYFIGLAVFLWGSCDTKKDFPDPSQNYFLKYYGKEGNHEAADFVVNTDGTMVICGSSQIEIDEGSSLKNYGQQIYLAKTDPQGIVLWEKTIGGFLDEEAKDIEITSDGNIVLVANVSRSTLDRDIILMTLTQDGDKIDSVSFGIQPGLDDEALSVTELADGFIVCGSKANPPSLVGGDARDAIQVRFTRSLSAYPIWSNSYSQGSLDVAIKAVPRSTSNTLIFGYTNGINANDPNNSVNYWVYDLNFFGDPGKSQNLIGSPLENEFMGSVTISPTILGDGFLLSGITTTANTNNIYLVKHDLSPAFLQGDIQFERKLEDDLGVITGNRVFSTPAAGVGFILLTNHRSTAGDIDMYLLKVDSRGQRLWQAPVILGGEGDDRAAAIAELQDGRILVLGHMTVGGSNGQQKIVLLKLNSLGRLSD